MLKRILNLTPIMRFRCTAGNVTTMALRLLMLAGTVSAEPLALNAPEDPESIEAVLYLAGQNRHEDALALFEQVKEKRPETIASIHGHKVAILYAAAGDRTRHEAHCRWLMDRYRDATLPTDAERSVKGYLLFPSADDPALMEHALERTRYATEHAETQGEGEFLLWFEGSQGMAEYRSGNYAEAVIHLGRAADAEDLYIHSLAFPFLAMAEHAQGNSESAENWLKKARAAAALLPEPGSAEYAKEWTDTLTTQIALREAEQIIVAQGQDTCSQ